VGRGSHLVEFTDTLDLLRIGASRILTASHDFNNFAHAQQFAVSWQEQGLAFCELQHPGT